MSGAVGAADAPVSAPASSIGAAAAAAAPASSSAFTARRRGAIATPFLPWADGSFDTNVDASAAALASVRVAEERPFNRMVVSARRMSTISGTVPPRLKGVGYHLKLGGAAGARIARLTHVKIDAPAVLKFIADAARARGGGAAGAAGADLATALAGFREWAWARFACLIPLPVAEEAFETLYHEAGICAMTRVCCEPACAFACARDGVPRDA